MIRRVPPLKFDYASWEISAVDFIDNFCLPKFKRTRCDFAYIFDVSCMWDANNKRGREIRRRGMPCCDIKRGERSQKYLFTHTFDTRLATFLFIGGRAAIPHHDMGGTRAGNVGGCKTTVCGWYS